MTLGRSSTSHPTERARRGLAAEAHTAGGQPTRHRAALALVSLLLSGVVAACSNSTLPQDVTAQGPPGIDPGGSGSLGSPGEDAPGTGPGTAPGTDGALVPSGPSVTAPRGATGTPTSQPGAQPDSGTTSGRTGGSTVGVTNDSITISASGGFTSYFGALAQKGYENGVLVWVAEVNARGGIHGRKIVMKQVDNQNTPEGSVAACKEETTNGSFVVLGVVVLTAENDCLDKAGVPILDRNAADLRPTWRYVLAESYVPAAAPTLVSFLKSSYMKAGGKKIGIVYSKDQPQAVGEHKAVVGELAEQGMNLVHTEQIAANQSFCVSEMSRMRDSGAEVVLLLLAVESPCVLRDAKAIGYSPQWLGDQLGSSQDALCLAAGPNCAGMFGLRLPTGTNDPAFHEYVEKVRNHRGDAAARTADTIDAAQYASAEHLGKILELAGRDLTRESFLAAARSMEPYDNKLTGPFTFKGRSVGLLALFPLQCCNPDGTFKVLGPAREIF